MQTYVTFDERAFHLARVAAGYRSTAQLARAANLSESYGHQIAHGLIPSAPVRVRLARVLDVEEAIIWRPVGQKTKETV